MAYLIYMIGVSGSGKTTIGRALDEELRSRGIHNLEFIDGDEIRSKFGNIFGYTFEERMKCNQCARVVLHYLLKHDISVILTQVAAYEAMRKNMREQFKESYIEVYIKCSYEECARRDVKGYYKKEQAGEIQNLNGANDTYEIPLNSEIVIDTEKETVEQAVKKIVDYLEKMQRENSGDEKNNIYTKS